MARLGCLELIFIGLVAQISFSTAYESRSLCMYQAMTFYENFGLEVAYKIIKRKLGSRVYIFTNLTQEWDNQKRPQDYDQTFMLIIGRTEKMYNLFEKLEEVNFQTGLLAEQIIDGNKPYLDWASEYIPPYNANETTVVENTSLSDTNEAFTFCEDFINKKYGMLPANKTQFTGLDLDLNSNHTIEIMQKEEEPYQEPIQIQKDKRLSPDTTFSGSEMEKDNNLQAMDEQEAYIKEKQRLIREQQMIEAKRNFDMKQGCRYYERNEPQMYERDHQMPRYYKRNDPPIFYERNIPGNYKQNVPEDLHERAMPAYHQQNVPPKFYQRNPPVDYEGNARPQYDYYQRHVPVDYEQNAHREYYRGYPPNAPQGFYQRYAHANYYDRNALQGYYGRYAVTPSPDFDQNAPPGFYQNNIQADYKQNAAQGFNQRDLAANHKQNVQGMSSARNTPQRNQNLRSNKDTRRANTSPTPSNGRRSDQATKGTASRRRSFMEAIHNFIFSDNADKEETNANEDEVRPRGRKIRKRMRAREVTETYYQPYEKVDEMNEIDEMENPQPDTIKHYIYVQHVDDQNAGHGQAPRNERKSARASQGSRVRKNEKPAARVRKTVGPNARKMYGNGMNQGENVRTNMEYGGHEANTFQKNDPIFNYKSNNAYDSVMSVQKDKGGINNCHVSQDGTIRLPPEQKDIGLFHPQNEAFQHIDKLPAVHVNQLNMRGARPINNPNNLPVLHEPHAQDISNLGVAMKNPPINNFEKIKQSRKVKSAPRVRKSRAKTMKKSAKRPRPVVKKSKMVTSAPQYHMDLDSHSTLHVIDVLHYDYEPRQKMLMLQ